MKKIVTCFFLILFIAVHVYAGCSKENYDGKLLCATVAITKDYVLIGARNGLQPSLYYEVLKNKSDMRYALVHKESEEDIGNVFWAIYDENNRPYQNRSGRFEISVGTGKMGLTPPSALNAKAEKLGLWVLPFSVFDEVADDLKFIRNQFIDLPDVDYIELVLSDFTTKEKLQEIRPFVQKIRDAGFSMIELGSVVEMEEKTVDDIAYKILDIAKPSEISRRKFYRETPLEASHGNRTIDDNTRSVLKMMMKQAQSEKGRSHESIKNKNRQEKNEGGIGDGLNCLLSGSDCDNANKAEKNN